jgi:hypothetical protein
MLPTFMRESLSHVFGKEEFLLVSVSLSDCYGVFLEVINVSLMSLYDVNFHKRLEESFLSKCKMHALSCKTKTTLVSL